ncbi:Heparan sulfate glucosamine 3-O-sulfotransferase 1 [Lamellibrachia satsuma]|nr:Heparan sulfate glucosamine 3-O-sulfotransferase 1 [Lamellibrachia satsuma]
MRYNRVSLRTLFVAVVTLAIVSFVAVTNRIKGHASYVQSSYDRMSTSLHSEQRSVAKPETETSTADLRRFDQHGTRQRRLPQCIIIGEMKCGTRALLAYLELHPDIITVIQELDYFNFHYKNGQEWYRNQMPLSKPGQVTIEKTPQYYETAEVPDRVYAMNASIKIILVVRNPVDRSVSHWLHVCFKARVAKEALNSCRTIENAGILTREGYINPNSKFIRRSSYVRNIENWTQLFPVGTQLHIVDGDKLVTDPVSELEKVETFLGLSHHITQRNIVFNEEKGFYCMVSDKGQEQCLGKDKGSKHPILKPEVEAKLRRYFKPLNERFYRIVRRDFGWT